MAGAHSLPPAADGTASPGPAFVPAPVPQVEVKRPDPNWQLWVYLGAGVAAILVAEPVIMIVNQAMPAVGETPYFFLLMMFGAPVVAFALCASLLRPRHWPTMTAGAGLTLIGAVIGVVGGAFVFGFLF